MTSLSQQYTYPIRSTNKEAQRASVYDDLFNQHIDTDGFEFGTCNPSTLVIPSIEEKPVFDSNCNEPRMFREIYHEPVEQHNYNKTLWSANSFGAQDIHEPSPTFNPWMSSGTKSDYQVGTNGFLNFQPTGTVSTTHNNLSLSRLRISYDPTLAPSHADELASETSITAAPLMSPYHGATQMGGMRREAHMPSPPASPYYVTKRRSTGEPRTPSPRRQRRTPSSKTPSRKTSGQQSPQSPRGGKLGGFVSYTPSDSEKLLTGVAPSGSSKTKARRERERERPLSNGVVSVKQ